MADDFLPIVAREERERGRRQRERRERKNMNVNAFDGEGAVERRKK